MSSLIAWFQAHPKTTFISRLISWILFAGVGPFLLIAFRFHIFKKVSQISISGWGIIGIIIMAVLVLSIVKYVKIALNAKYTLGGQILGGICKVIIPLLAVYLIAYSIKDNIQAFLDVMGLVIIMEAVAIPLNPLPEWAYNMQKEVRADERKDTMDYLLDGFFSRKKDEDKGGN